jgi:hypothetical protein
MTVHVIVNTYMYIYDIGMWFDYLCFLASSNEASCCEALEGIIVGGAFISPLKLVPATCGVHNVEFPINM